MDTETQNYKSKSSYAIWCITPNGLALGLSIKDKLGDADLYASDTILDNCISDNYLLVRNIYQFGKLGPKIKEQFNNYIGHVFIFSTGIAVRLIAPNLVSKMKDPAIAVIDDNGNHVVSLLSGHIGGANELAIKIAAIIHATPVITTATDTNNLPAIDTIAKENNIHIETPENIKHINMAFLLGNPVRLQDPYHYISKLIPENLLAAKKDKSHINSILCSPYKIKVPRETLILRPKLLSVGIGCNRGTNYQRFLNFGF